MKTLTRQTIAIADTERASGVLPGGLRQALREANISERKGYRLAKAGKLPFALKLGSTYVVPRAAFLRWLAGEFPSQGTSSTSK